jgi:hypothetical protein
VQTLAPYCGPRAFGGAPLDGDNCVRLVYVDEAGISGAKQEPWLVVAGVVIHGDGVLNGVKAHLERIMLRHIPKHYQAGFVFHALELFNGGGKVFKRTPRDMIGPPEWPIERRLAIADELAAVPQKFKLPIALGFVDRANFPATLKKAPEGWTQAHEDVMAHAAAHLSCTLMADHWMRRNASNENCLMIVEDNDRARNVIREMQVHHQNKREILEPNIAKHFPLRKVQEDPLFQPKRQSNPLLLADFIAYVFKRKLMKDTRYDRFGFKFKDQIISFEDGF